MKDSPAIDKANKDWPLDFRHENGRYQCLCIQCSSMFYGHKSRVLCRECHNKNISEALAWTS